MVLMSDGEREELRLVEIGCADDRPDRHLAFGADFALVGPGIVADHHDALHRNCDAPQFGPAKNKQRKENKVRS